MTRVLAFTSKHCGPCRVFAPRFKLWAEKYARDGVEFVSVDSDGDRDAVTKYGIAVVPTVVVEADGVVAAAHKGAPAEAWLAGYLPAAAGSTGR